ncbi:MAG: pirin family protein [Deltaproteobacteria bacterium]|jgi:redox-sensitive bicupin YhaK (pirin superfamily)|nr:pirin family protein [Deltaproteobacteria bacterium]
MRSVKKTVRGRGTVDGAGVNLVRVLSRGTVEDFDPFLMLDSFDSRNPEDYVAGFPTHPHRGIETITYLIEGQIEHQDSLGHKGLISGGSSQWMTAGSGIMHQEMPLAAPRMLGLQIWLNLPQAEKMVPPTYRSLDAIPTAKTDHAEIRVISGSYGAVQGFSPAHVKATLYDVLVEPGRTAELETNPDENVFIFLIEGEALVDGQTIAEKTAVLFGPGRLVKVEAPAQAPSRFIFFSAPPLRESVAWNGPIVMNTEEELERTFAELRNGEFIKSAATGR